MSIITNIVPNKLHPITGEDLRPTVATVWQDGVTPMYDILCGGLYNKDTEPTSPTFGKYFKWNAAGPWPISRLTAVNQGNFQKLINDFGTRSATIVIDKTVAIESSMTIPANIKIDWYPGSVFNISNGVVLNINSEINEEPHHLFYGSGVPLTRNSYVYPEWFGAKGDGTTNDTDPLQKAIDTRKKVILVKDKTYKYNKTLVLKTNSFIQGQDKYKSTLLPDIDNFTHRGNWNPATIVNENAKLGTTSDDFSNPNYNILLDNFRVEMKSEVVTNMNSIFRFSAQIGLTIRNCSFLVQSSNGKGHNAIIDLHAAYRDASIHDCDFDVTTNSLNYGGAIWVQNEGTVDCEHIDIFNNKFTVASKDETLAIYTINGSGSVKNVKAYNNVITKPDYTTSPSSMFTVFGKAQDVDIYDNWLFSNQPTGLIDGLLRIGVSSDSNNTNKPVRIKVYSNRVIGVFLTSSAIVGYSGTDVELVDNIIIATNVEGITNTGIVTPSSSLSRSWKILRNQIFNFYTGINGGSFVENNTITDSSIAIRGYRRIVSNIITGAKVRALNILALGANENYEILSNQLNTTNAASEIIGLNTGTFGYGRILIAQNQIVADTGGSTKGITQIAGSGPLGTIQDDSNTYRVTGTPIDVTADRTLSSLGNLAGLANTTTARTNLGLGTMATQATNNVNISGGVITGLTSLGMLTFTVGIYTKSVIEASAPMFAGVTPISSFSPLAAPTIPYEDVVIQRNSFSSASAGLRRLGYIFKMSSEASTGESNKSGGIILESNAVFSNVPDLHLVVANVKVLSLINGGAIKIPIAPNTSASTHDILTINTDGTIGKVTSDLKQPITNNSVTADLLLTVNHHTLLVDCTTGNITISLPTATSAYVNGKGRIYIIKRRDNSGNTITIDPNGTETIDGATTKTLTTQWEVIRIQSNSANWYII